METTEKKPPAKPDRRAVRSKRLIIEAWRELIQEKEYKKITVSDIVERADIGRATFYAHFEDKEDLGRFLFNILLQQIEAEIQTTLGQSQTETGSHQNLVPSLALFRIAGEKHRGFKPNADNPVSGLTMLIPPLVKRFEDQMEALNLPTNEDEVPIRLIATFLISGLIRWLTDWVLADMPEPPEAMDRMYQSLARPTLDGLLGS